MNGNPMSRTTSEVAARTSMPPLQSEIQRLERNVGDLLDVIGVLQARLEPVLSTEPPGDAQTLAERSGESPMQATLIGHNSTLEAQLVRLRVLIDRLTL